MTIESAKLKCIVCENASARDRSVLSENWKKFECPSCGKFAIAADYAEKLMALKPDDRKAVLKTARKMEPDAEYPMIDIRAF